MLEKLTLYLILLASAWNILLFLFMRSGVNVSPGNLTGAIKLISKEKEKEQGKKHSCKYI